MDGGAAPTNLDLEDTEFWEVFRYGQHLGRALGLFDRNSVTMLHWSELNLH